MEWGANMSREIPTEEEYTKYFLAIRAQMRRCGGAWRSYLRFFLSTWQAVGYKFRVYMTRRCFNLNEMLFTLYCFPWTEKDWRSIFADGNFIPREENTDKRAQSLKDVQKTFITQSALLGYVRSITQEYYEKGVFPKILIVDELAIYAKQIRVFLQEFESAILYVWREAGYETNSDKTRRNIHRDFQKAIDVRVYAKSRMLPQSVSWIQAEKTMSIAQWRGMILEMSLGISESDVVENTTYAPFFRMSQEQYSKLVKSVLGKKWLTPRTWTYRKLKADIWQKPLTVPSNSGEQEVKLLYTLRVHEDKGSENVRIVPLVLFKSMSYKRLEEVSKCLAEYLEEERIKDAEHIVSVLRDTCPMLWKIKMQWISFFVSAFAFFDALETLKNADISFYGMDFSVPDEPFDLPRPYETLDLTKIAKNFGRLSDSSSALFDLYVKLNSDVSQAKTELYGLWGKLQNYLEPLWISRDDGDFCKEAGQYITLAEDFFYKTGIDYEKDLLAEAMYWNRFEDDDPSKAQKKERSSLEDYLGYFSNQRDVRYHPEDCIGVLLMTMDTGVTAMTIRDSKTRASGAMKWTHRVVNWVRAGEQSLYLGARRYYRFFPALIELEARCLRSGYSVLENVRAFGKALEKEGCFRKSGSVPQRMADFYDCVQKYGYRLRDWNFDFLIDLDAPTFHKVKTDWNSNVRPKREWDGGDWEEEKQEICKEGQDYYLYERQQQQYYVLKARNFPLS